MAIAAKILQRRRISREDSQEDHHISGIIAYYAIQHVKSDRRSTGSFAVDVMGSGTQLNGSTRLSSLDDACVLNTINGDSNVPFFKEIAATGLTAADCPVVSFSLAEDELRALHTKDLVGELGCWT